MTTAWFQSFRDIRIFHDLGFNEDFTVSKKSNVILYKKCVLHMSLNILHTLAESFFFCCCQGDGPAALWRSRQVWPAAENQPEEEEIRRAGSEVGQV